MATFPALKPTTRAFTPGQWSHSRLQTVGGGFSRVRQNNVYINQRLRLSFVALSEAEMLSIRAHYRTQQGRFLSFTLPSETLAGTENPSQFTGTGYSWVYVDSPKVSDMGRQYYSVSLELMSVPPEGANVNGAEFVATVSITSGGATGSANIAGTTWTSTVAFTGGIGAGNKDVSVPSSVDLTLGAIESTQAGTNIKIYPANTDFSVSTYEPVVATVKIITPLAIELTLQPYGPASPSGVVNDYFVDMAAQIWGWERLGYIEWWGSD